VREKQTQQKHSETTNLNRSLNPFRYADCTVRKAFVEMACIGVLVVASLAQCTAPLSQPEVHQGARGGPIDFTAATIGALLRPRMINLSVWALLVDCGGHLPVDLG
jgi:hypothetical protein